MDIVMGDDFEDQIKDSSYIEYYLKKKHQIQASLNSDFDDTVQDNPFNYDAFAEINKVATILNYDVYSVLEHERKNPFKMIKTSISSEIKTYSKQLDKLAKQNRESLVKLKEKAIKKVEQEKKRDSITNALAAKELEYLKQTVISLELKQLAESCVRVHSKRKLKFLKGKKNKTQYEYRMVFDESVRIPPLWLSEDQYNLLNQNREEFKGEGTKNDNRNGLLKVPSNEESNLGFCHQ